MTVPFLSSFVLADETTDTTTTTASGGFDWTLIIMIGLIVVVGFFMWRSSRRRRTQAQELQTSMVPGVEVMTSFGLFGRLISIDELGNSAEIELAPGTVVKVHRQTLVKVVEPGTDGGPRSVDEAAAIAEAEQVAREAAASSGASDAVSSAEEPRYGERIEPSKGNDLDGEGKGPKNS